MLELDHIDKREVVDMGDFEKLEKDGAVMVLDKLELIEHWNNPVMVLMPSKEEYFIDGDLEICLSADSFAKCIHEIPGEQKLLYSEIPMVVAIRIVCKNECKGMRIHGFEEGEVYLTKEELSTLEETADLIHLFQALKVKQITKKRVCQLLQNRMFYMLGEMPTAATQDEDIFHMDIVLVKGEEYQAVKLYTTKERAEKYNVRNFNIHGYTFKELGNMFRKNYGLMIEAEQGFATVFGPEEI
ncbi:hypothetical protein [[Clostridium] polysaccharolyticum]|uniref:Uncharacterized protein n=1 Tax=[Clostridium] polysaccharolyticum TaxID=29364 RepID=A0A1I0EMW7_9FIRM|nr:hypothetical protein [[Clostridium] polysaccharolyticum]SET46603.1 hypothetical protein SAMN04487772_1237 [[Clostridium] polysaccharolyticum]